MYMFNLILNPLSQFEIIDFLYFEASLTDNIHISFPKIGLYVILSLVFIMILALFAYKFNRLVSNKWSIYKESIYVTIIKGLFKHGLTFFSGLIPGGCVFALLPFLVGWISHCNYLDFSLQVVKFSTKFCSSNSGVSIAVTARNYSTLATPRRSVDNLKLNPWWVAGFVDGEGCFHISITLRQDTKLGWEVQPRFKIKLHRKDQPVLEDVKNCLRVGKIYKSGLHTVQLQVWSIKELKVILENFYKFPLITQKRADFLLLLRVIELMERREHLTPEGLHKIVAIKATMNRGLSPKLKLYFPQVVQVTRPLVENAKIPDPNWLAGFTSAEGCFMVKITGSKTHSAGFRVELVFQLTQHSRDEKLLISFISYLNCGVVTKDRESYKFRVTKLDDITHKIIPLLKKYPIRGVKALDFADWCKAAELIKNKKHLTAEGFEEIRNIKAGMNRGRKLD